jgi:hypothetical protein
LSRSVTTNPELTVVVPFVNELSDLTDTLAALDRQRADVRLEVLVVNRQGDKLTDDVRQKFSWARVLPTPAEASIPEMRALAFRAATGTAVAVIEDHVIVPEGWAKALLDAQSPDSPVVGGSVRNLATGTVLDWAAFLCEYSHCLEPMPAGEVLWLTGNNVIYPRALLEQFREVTESGGWENRLHDTLREKGVPLVCRPEISVGHKKHYTFWEYFSQRYIYARSYAGARVSGATLGRRLAFGGAALLLPPLLFWRTISRIRSKGRHSAELVKSLPLLALFVLAWAAGEAVGYTVGPGNSLAKVK